MDDLRSADQRMLETDFMTLGLNSVKKSSKGVRNDSESEGVKTELQLHLYGSICNKVGVK